MNTFEVTIET